MIKVNISDFSDYDNKGIYEFLFLQNETEFEITIPKRSIAHNDENYEVFVEYLSAAYAGQRLSEIAGSFAYYVPCSFNLKPFLFEVTITEMEQLTDILYLLVQGLHDTRANESFLTFHGLAADFLNNAYDNKVECNTWGLLHIANHFLAEELKNSEQSHFFMCRKALAKLSQTYQDINSNLF